MTMVMVTHEMGSVRCVADRVILMAEGQIIAEAKPGRFFIAPANPRTQEFLRQIVHSTDRATF